MPGMKPYYQLAVDGKLIGKSKKVLSGSYGDFWCMRSEEAAHPLL